MPMRLPSELKHPAGNETVVTSPNPRILRIINWKKKNEQSLLKALEGTSLGLLLLSTMPQFPHLYKVVVVPQVAFQMSYELENTHTHTRTKIVPNFCSRRW